MNNKLNAFVVLGALGGTLANAEIPLTDDLSLAGYIDMSAVSWDAPDGYDGFDASVAEVEVDFNFTTDVVSAVAEISFDGYNANWETVTVTYAASDELSISAGNMLSYLGWEAYDATGLYQFSYAYRGFSPLYPAYAAGASIDYVTDQFSFGVWVGEGGQEEVSYEVAFKFTGVEGFTFFAAFADDPGYETVNLWASYEVEGFTFALEYVGTDWGNGENTTGYLAMVNYATGNFGITFRYSHEDDDWEAEDWELFTISPSYTFTDHLLGLLEFSSVLNGEESFGGDYQIAAELIFTY